MPLLKQTLKLKYTGHCVTPRNITLYNLLVVIQENILDIIDFDPHSLLLYYEAGVLSSKCTAKMLCSILFVP